MALFVWCQPVRVDDILCQLACDWGSGMRDGLRVPLYPAGRCVSRAENTLKLIKAREPVSARERERVSKEREITLI